jgi:hypothetical protein
VNAADGERARFKCILHETKRLVWDLETLPDLPGFAAANDLVGKSDVEVREAIGDKFPKHIYHSIVCIGHFIAPGSRITGSLDCGRGRRPPRGCPSKRESIRA